MKRLVKVMLLCVTFGTFFACSEGEFDDSGANSGSNNSGNGVVSPEAIDLGLPSGIKWASFNVGATRPEEYGGFYAWGETEEKEDYSWETYKWCNGSYDTMTKYCASSPYGIADDKTILDLEDDVAHVKWGSNWRMPTTEQQKELLDECTWEWTALNNVNGYKVTGPNGNSIFLPATGVYIGTDVYYIGEGYFWACSLNYGGSDLARYVAFNGDGYICYSINRSYGIAVRPVCE